MKIDFPRRIPLSGTPAETIFTRQKDEISCGPACLTTVAKLYRSIGVTAADENSPDEQELLFYADFRDAANPRHDIGTSEKIMKSLCEKYLPYESAGPSSYHGGVAIADVTMSGEGHYIVFLCKKDDMILFYEPFHHEFVINRIENVNWVSGFEKSEEWSINFMEFPGNSFERWLDMAVIETPPAAHRAAF